MSAERLPPGFLAHGLGTEQEPMLGLFGSYSGQWEAVRSSGKLFGSEDGFRVTAFRGTERRRNSTFLRFDNYANLRFLSCAD